MVISRRAVHLAVGLHPHNVCTSTFSWDVSTPCSVNVFAITVYERGGGHTVLGICSPTLSQQWRGSFQEICEKFDSVCGVAHQNTLGFHALSRIAITSMDQVRPDSTWANCGEQRSIVHT